MTKKQRPKTAPIKVKPTQFDLFGNAENPDYLLREKFIEPPFSILDTRAGLWHARKKKWLSLGIKSEVGRELLNTTQRTEWMKRGTDAGGSIFDPALCEVLLHWFCPPGGKVLDPFAGGSVRGIVSAKLGFKYIGFEIRKDQVESNYQQAEEIFKLNEIKDISKRVDEHARLMPHWVTGDSNIILGEYEKGAQPFDFVLSCPPYWNLEKYSDLPGDVSNMKYPDFLTAYGSIIKKSCNLLKPGALACFVVGEVRDKKGNFIGLVPDTITLFAEAGMDFYNEAILINSVGSGCLRADVQFTAGKKLVKLHQNILVFRKPLKV